MYKQLHLSGIADRLLITGEISQSVKIDANGFFASLLKLPPRRSVDFLHIAAGIYSVDRVCKRKKNNGNEVGARQLHLVFSVQDLSFWQRAEINDLLAEILHFLTGDDWQLKFEPASRNVEDPGYQDYLQIPSFEAHHGALYSGGLDSAAGLANQLLVGKNKFLLLTVGHRAALHSEVEKQLSALAYILGKCDDSTPEFLHSTLTVNLQGGKAKRLSVQEKTQRSRAFLFCTAACLAAEAYKLSTMQVFENGVGAINLPLMSGMLNNGLATRGAHPTFLGLMSDLASKVIAKPIHFELPFAEKTKASMLKVLANTKPLEEWAQLSKSCIHTSLRIVGKSHCGCCPGCIERRQAFRIAGINENPSDYQTDIFAEAIENKNKANYFRLYKRDALDWINGKIEPRKRMRNHLRFSGVPRSNFTKISRLQIQHSQEVINVFGSPYRNLDETVNPVRN